MDIRQTPEYANYLKLLGWQTIKIKQSTPRLTRQVFVKKFPLIGSIIKVQRIKPPIPFEEIEKVAKEKKSFLIQIDQEPPKITNYKKHRYKINKTPYFPTKTIQIDLTQTEDKIFTSFSEAKRRAVRKAIKNGVIVKETNDCQEFLKLKKKSLLEKFVLPIMAEKEIKTLWQAFWPKNGKIILAYFKNKPVAGIFLLHYTKVAYYWLAAATSQGKKLFAPTLLVWEVLKTTKKLGCELFDFEGIYDERFPVKNWLGFTKFKEGFGGREIIYPPSLIKTRLFPCFAK